MRKYCISSNKYLSVILVLALLLPMFTPVIQAAGNTTRSITIRMFDSGGDGWNGATLSATVDGTPLLCDLAPGGDTGAMTMSDTEPVEYSFNAEIGSTITLSQTVAVDAPDEQAFIVFYTDSSDAASDFSASSIYDDFSADGDAILAIVYATDGTGGWSDTIEAAPLTFTVAAPTASGATVNALLEPSAVSATSITLTETSMNGLNPGNQSIEYGRSTTNDATTVSTWQSALKFTGLTKETTYYFFARSQAKTGYYAGTPTAGLEVQTTKEPTVTQANANAAVAEVLNSEAGVEATNISYVGNSAQLGVFNAPNEMGLPISEGIVLSTGNISTVFSATAASDVFSDPFTDPGYPDLRGLLGNTLPTDDEAILEFELVPTGYELSFQYFFASSEYTENVEYNDIFALWIYDPELALESGETFTDGSGLFHYNTAKLPYLDESHPGGNTVTISSTRAEPPAGQSYRYNYDMNCMPYAKKVTANDLNGYYFSYNGYTEMFGADASDLYDSYGQKLVSPGRTLRIRIAIADVSDSNYNSTVFIKANSVQFTRPGAPAVEIDTSDQDNIVVNPPESDEDAEGEPAGGTLYFIPKTAYDTLVENNTINTVIDQDGLIADVIDKYETLNDVYEAAMTEYDEYYDAWEAGGEVGDPPTIPKATSLKVENYDPELNTSVPVTTLDYEKYIIVLLKTDEEGAQTLSEPTVYNKNVPYIIDRYLDNGSGGYTLVSQTLAEAHGIEVLVPPYSTDTYTALDARPLGFESYPNVNTSVTLSKFSPNQHLVQYYERNPVPLGTPILGALSNPEDLEHGDEDVDFTTPVVDSNGATISAQGFQLQDVGTNWSTLTMPISELSRSTYNGKKLRYYVTYGDDITIYSNVVTLSVDKAAAPEIIWPTSGSTITYGQKLSASTLTDNDDNGTFGWTNSDTVPTATGSIEGYSVTYKPSSEANFNYDYSGVSLTKAIPLTMTFTVTLYQGSPTTAFSSLTSYTYGVGVTLPSDGVKTGYSFGGWYASSDFQYDPITSITGTDSGNKNFYAKWTLNSLPTILNFSVTGLSAIYDGDTKSVTIGYTGGDYSVSTAGAIIITYKQDDTPVTSPTNVGSYDVYVTTAGGSKYLAVSTPIAIGTLIIAKASISPSISLTGWKYGQTANTPTISGNTGSGTQTIQYFESDQTTELPGVPSDVGTYYVQASITETDNYNSAQTSKESFEIIFNDQMNAVRVLLNVLPDPVEDRDDADQVAATTSAYNTLSTGEQSQFPSALLDKLTTAQNESAAFNKQDNEGDVAGDDLLWSVRLVVDAVPANNNDNITFRAHVPGNKDLLAVFDVRLINTLTGEEYEMELGQTVTVNLSQNTAGKNGIVLYHEKENGTLEIIPATVNGNSLTFIAYGFSLYGIAANKVAPQGIQNSMPEVDDSLDIPKSPLTSGTDTTLLWMFLLGVNVLGIGILIITRRKMRCVRQHAPKKFMKWDY
jgi:uncharacterized repeat protein (TIGR02543 family)